MKTLCKSDTSLLTEALLKYQKHSTENNGSVLYILTMVILINVSFLKVNK